MNDQDKQEFRNLVKEGSVEALKSEEGKAAIVEALKTPESKNVLIDNFIEAFHEVVVPTVERLHEDHEKRINALEEKVGVNL